MRVSLGDQQLGSAAIDPAIVDTTDEVGRASVTVTIPEGTPGGALALTVSVPETGTTIEVPIEVAAAQEAIANLKAPKITGSPRVGKTLTANPGTWSVAGASFAYQWNRDGSPIAGATAAQYTPVAADAGAAITVTVTASAEGYADGAATSKPVSVRKLDSVVTGSASRTFAPASSTLSYTLRVRAKAGGAVPTGDVVIYDGSTPLVTVTLDAADDGRATITLPKLKRGIHLLRAKYAGSDQFARATGGLDLVLLY